MLPAPTSGRYRSDVNRSWGSPHQPSRTADFFKQILSWKSSTDLSSWRMATTLSIGPYGVSGLSDLSTPVYPPGLPAHVAYHLATDNIDHVVSDAEAAGAEVLVAPFDAGDEGRVATLVDPFGAPVSLVQRTGGRSWSHPTGSLGTPASLRHTSDAPAAARRFYMDTLRVNDPAVHFADFDPALPPVPASIPGWTGIITVRAVSEVAKAVAAYAGGSVTSYDGSRPLTLLTSPDGVRIGVASL
ncbi:VOC family protein [Promicromonospora sp. NPDC023987]|uniref:VOC family protein n=1 Tax=Promicromonospora sp. NPDC023987 TaxID=3155360 RepID=UPI0033D07F36